jgi:hypothetical protein
VVVDNGGASPTPTEAEEEKEGVLPPKVSPWMSSATGTLAPYDDAKTEVPSIKSSSAIPEVS